MHYDWSCNLACPSCRGEIQQVSGPAAVTMGRLHDVVVDELLAGARMISLTGTGDPFASQFLRDFLLHLDPTSHPALEAVHLHTNAIMWTPRLWEQMTGLHQLAVSTDISIDAATPETYHVLRRPARWDRLLENLAYITTLPSVTSIGISMTVSAVNHAELLAFHDFGARLAERSDGKVTFVEYKRARPRAHHDEASWRPLDLEALDAAATGVLLDQLDQLEDRRAAGAVPEIRSNLGEFLDLALTH
jgi:molybdenum cofactor biosynthesis enzyme MoaA